VLLGGERLKRKGYFYAPSVLTDLARDCALLREEVFGPVAAVVLLRALMSLSDDLGCTSLSPSVRWTRTQAWRCDETRLAPWSVAHEDPRRRR
jgi:hypothetical protein